MDKYGATGTGETEDKAVELALEATSYYQEFGADGKVKRPVKHIIRGQSRYEEDIYHLNHTAVWGSWWNAVLGWGFSCCHQTKSNQRCIGEKGKKIAVVREYNVVKQREEELKKVESEA